jgi:hypothetical protein
VRARSGLAKGRLGVRQERFASRGEGHSARSPGKQRNTNFLFQLPDLLTQGRLGDPQHFRRTREMALSDDGQEIAQVPQFHMNHLHDDRNDHRPR